MTGQVLRILHVEDDDDDAFLFARAMGRTGWPAEVTRFHTALEAIDHLERITSPEVEAPHLIISDLKLPVMDGADFVSWVRRSRFSCLPVILFSSSSIDGDVLRAYRCGANSFATKPMTAHQLEHTLGTVLRYWGEVCSAGTRGQALHAHANGDG